MSVTRLCQSCCSSIYIHLKATFIIIDTNALITMLASEKFQRLLDGFDPYNADTSTTYTTFAQTFDKQQLEMEYNTSLQYGLSLEEASQLLTQYGSNELPKHKVTPWWLEWIKIDILLWGAAIYLSISDDETPRKSTHINITLGIVAIIFLLIWSFIYYGFCHKPIRDMNRLSEIIPTVTVTRDGHKQGISQHDLVPGDIVDLTTEMMVPADIRIIDCSPDMQVDRSSLHGSPDPFAMDWKPCSNEALLATNLCFFGTIILNGFGRGVVIATGCNTYIAHTVEATHKLSVKKMKQTSELKNGNQISYKVSLVTFLVELVFLIITNGESMNYIFVLMICFLNLIELMFLVTVVYTTMSFTRKMITQNVKLKNMEIVDVLPNMTHFLTDTAGIITSNALNVSHIHYDMMACECDNDQPSSTLIGDFYDIQTRRRNPNFLKLVRCGTLCNTAYFEDSYLSGYRGNAIECAMLKFTSGHIGAECDMNVKEFRIKHETLHQIAYNKHNQYGLSIHKLPNDMIIGHECLPKENDDDTNCLLQIKGDPYVILTFCNQLCLKDGLTELTEQSRTEILDHVDDLRCKGLEVVGVAELVLNKPQYDINILEPIIDPRYEDEYKDNNNFEGVYMVYEDEVIPISINIDDDCCVYHLQQIIEDTIYIPKAAQRIAFSDQGLLHINDNLRSIGIKHGSKLYLFRGPYLFEGTNAENSNFPMNKNKLFDEVIILAYLRYIQGFGLELEVPNIIEELVMNYYCKHDEGFAFIGLYGMTDRMCRGIPACIRLLNALSIKAVLVTSDQHITTTKAIAHKCDIIGQPPRPNVIAPADPNVSIITGDELQQTYTDKEYWNNTLDKQHMIFSRVSVQHKLDIITQLQERNGIVGYLGDGSCGDSACLKHADIGIAFGIQGTHTIKQIADVILLDDSMISLVNGINDTYKLSKYSAILILGYYLSLIVIFLSSLVFVFLYDSRYKQGSDYNYLSFFIWVLWNKITVLLYSTKLIQTRIQNLKDLD
eukprot:1086721_1